MKKPTHYHLLVGNRIIYVLVLPCIYSFHQYLQAAHCDSYIRAEGSQLRSQ